jgi:hypothetical protein
MRAYDYDAQQWVSGRRGAALRLVQDRETLFLLDDPGYVHMMGLSLHEVPVMKLRLEQSIDQARNFLMKEVSE